MRPLQRRQLHALTTQHLAGAIDAVFKVCDTWAIFAPQVRRVQLG
jgi:hypothetical protein